MIGRYIIELHIIIYASKLITLVFVYQEAWYLEKVYFELTMPANTQTRKTGKIVPKSQQLC